MNSPKQDYMFAHAALVTMLRWTWAALGVLSIAALLSAIAYFGVPSMLREWRPLIVRVDKLSNAQAVDYRSWELSPIEDQAVLKGAFINFCDRYYRRNRYTIEADQNESLMFLNPRISPDQFKVRDLIKAFGSSPVESVAVAWDGDSAQVVLRLDNWPCTVKKPCSAMAEFYLDTKQRGSNQATRQGYIDTFTFERLTKAPASADFLKINPLGVMIDAMQEDPALSEGR